MAIMDSTMGVHESQLQHGTKLRQPSRWLRKTKLCAYYQENHCNLGDDCLFAHSKSELQHGPDLYKTQICKDFMNGKCKHADCSFAHGVEELQPFPTLKQKLCKWHRKGRCHNGESCSFAHGEQDLRADTFSTESKDGKATPIGLSPATPIGVPWPQQPNNLLLPVAMQSTAPALAAFNPQEKVSAAVYYTNAYGQRMPLSSEVAPFVPLSACDFVPFVKEDKQDMFRDDMSTSAETAGYLSD